MPYADPVKYREHQKLCREQAKLLHPERLREARRKWADAHREETRAKAATLRANPVYRKNERDRINRYRAQNRGKFRAESRLRHTGWTQEQYAVAFEAQKGLCYICHSDNNGRTLHADHCHDTGKPGKLLCGRCNRALGFLEHHMAQAWMAYLEEVR
jgi:uncharacterized CHY-type Zn-finger protein